MRRHLLIVRHAKSSWDELGLADHDRPLAPRGRKALPRMQDHLLDSGHQPELVLCSSSQRTRQTLEGISAAIPAAARIEVERDLYLADATDLQERLRTIDDAVRCALLIGHNPTVQDLALVLAGGGDEDARRQLVSKVPTGAIVTFHLDGPWASLGPGAGHVDSVFLPRPPRS